MSRRKRNPEEEEILWCGKRLTYANVIASLALFLALGGGAVYAASHKANQVGTGKLKQNAVTAGKST